jgi:hypothetical protein
MSGVRSTAALSISGTSRASGGSLFNDTCVLLGSWTPGLGFVEKLLLFEVPT